MQFVFTHKQSEGTADTLTPANRPVELILISNKEGESRFLDMALVSEILAPAIKRVCQVTESETTFFPHTPAPRPYHTGPR